MIVDEEVTSIRTTTVIIDAVNGVILGKDDLDRRVMINTIGPVWDANEVWLIVAGASMFAAFPEWYATLFSGFYLPLFLILVALIVRGVAFEYRGKDKRPEWRAWWDRAIFFGSAVPALLWGVAFANIVHGVPIDAAHEYTGNLFTLLNPYALLVAVMFGASASFITPVGYQTNVLIYTPGAYRFSDFLKVGAPLNLLLLITAAIFIPIFWPS